VWRKVNTTRAKLAIILLLAIGLRVFGLQEQSLSSDELLELDIAKSSVHEIIHKSDGFPPLYHLLLHGWLKLFNNDMAARWLSMLLGSLAVFSLWKITPWLDDTKSRLRATLLLAISPFHIWYSQEARAYPLYFLAALLAVGFFGRALQTNRRRDWTAYGLACIAGIFTHYFFVILMVIHAVVLLTQKRRWHDLKRALLAHGSVALCLLPATGLLLDDFAYQTTTILSRIPFNFVTLGYTFFSFMAGYAVGPSIRELHSMSSSQAIFAALPWLIIIASGVLVLFFNSRRELHNKMWWQRIAVWLLLPVLLCGMLAETIVVSFKLQYVLWASILLLLWLGRAIASSFGRKSTKLAVAFFCLLFAFSLYNRRFEAAYQNDDAKALASYLETQTDQQTPIFVMACYMTEPLRYYLGEGWRIYPLPDAGHQAQHLKEVLQALEPHCVSSARFWLVYTRAFHGDPTGKFKLAVLENQLARPRAEFAGIELFQGN